MNDIPIIKTFVYENEHYFYDTYKNQLLHVSKAQFIEICELQKIGRTKYMNLNKETRSYSEVTMLINRGFLRGQVIETVKHSCTDYWRHLADRCMRGITLQVTRDCNFKCRYCPFTREHNINRSHEKENMSWDIAKRSMDYLFEHSKDARNVFVSFYGGEPLLNFDLIKEVVNYANDLFTTKKIQYRFTINASLLSDKIIDFLIEHDFKIDISLDGPKEIQNNHRKFYETGNGTFDSVYNNVMKIKETNNEYFKRQICFLPIIFFDENYTDVISFFEKIGVARNKVFVRNPDMAGIDYTYGREVFVHDSLHKPEYDEGYYSLPGELNYQHMLKNYQDKKSISSIWHHKGPCLPAIDKLMVNTDGVFYICEKANDSDANIIGNLNDGLNFEYSLHLLNIGRLTEDKCKQCWSAPLCSMCVVNCFDIEKNEINVQQKLIACNQECERIRTFLEEYIQKSETKRKIQK